MKSTLKVHNPRVMILLICITIYGITDQGRIQGGAEGAQAPP